MGCICGTSCAANKLSLPLRTHQAPKMDFICEYSPFVVVNLLGIKTHDGHCGGGRGSQYFINPLIVGSTYLYFFFISILKVDLGYLGSRKIIRS